MKMDEKSIKNQKMMYENMLKSLINDTKNFFSQNNMWNELIPLSIIKKTIENHINYWSRK